MESLVNTLQHSLLVVVDVEVGKGAVAAFSAATAYGNNRQVVVLCCKHIGVFTQLRFVHARTGEEGVGAQRSHLSLGFKGGKFVVFLIHVAQGVVDDESCILQTFHQVNHIGLIHVARACSATIQIIRGNTEKSHAQAF